MTWITRLMDISLSCFWSNTDNAVLTQYSWVVTDEWFCELGGSWFCGGGSSWFCCRGGSSFVCTLRLVDWKLVWPSLHMLVWCWPLQQAHLMGERQSWLKWCLLRHTKYLPVLFRMVSLCPRSVMVVHDTEGWPCRQYKHLGWSSLATNDVAVRMLN